MCFSREDFEGLKHLGCPVRASRTLADAFLSAVAPNAWHTLCVQAHRRRQQANVHCLRSFLYLDDFSSACSRRESRLKVAPTLHHVESRLTCIWWSLAMLQTQVAAYLLHSPSPSDVSLTAACRPPPRIAAPRVSAFAVRLQRVITAKRLQSTSGQDASLIRDAGHPDWAIISYRGKYNRDAREGQGERR